MSASGGWENGLGLQPTVSPHGELFFGLAQAGRLLGLSKSGVESRTRLDPSHEDHVPSELLPLDGPRPKRWIPVDAVVARRATLLARLGAQEARIGGGEGAAPPLAADPGDARGPERDGPVQARVRALEERVRSLEESRSTTRRTIVANDDLASHVAALESQVRDLHADMRDLLAADAAKMDIIRRHLPIGSLHD